MPEINSITNDSSIASNDIDAAEDITNIGIELEYPVGDGIAACGQSRHSSSLRGEWREKHSSDWTIPDFDGNMGYMGRDHVGAEITSGILDLHSDQPEEWYVKSINQAEDMGYPFAMSGQGETTFGLHLHLSDVPHVKAKFVYEMCQEPWALTFFCSSVSQDSLCPWRYGGVSGDGLLGNRRFDDESPPAEISYNQRIMNHYAHDDEYDGHYEFRLNEPTHPDHFAAVCHFFRLLDVAGTNAAYDFAHDMVYSADDRLTPVKQYKYLYDSYNQFPTDAAIDDEQGNSEAAAAAARELYEIMAEHGYE